jgi:hypothetical protein
MIINKEITLQELWLSHAGFRVRFLLHIIIIIILHIIITYSSACYILDPIS